MAGSLAASVHEHHAEASETFRWLISFARFVPFPSSPSPYPGLVPLGKSELSSSPDGTWQSTSISTAYLRLVDEVNRSDVILSVELAGKILEEQYISKLNFSWPDMTSVSGFPPCGSREILVSYKDSANEIQKFALRFSTCDAVVTFMVALKEKLKGLEEAGLQERENRSDTSFQPECNPGNETIPRAIVEETNMVKHLGSYVPEMQPRLEYQTGQNLYTPQRATKEEPNRAKPPDSYLPDMQPRIEYETGRTLYPPHFTTVEEPNMVKHLGSYVPEMQPRLEYQAGQILYPPQSTLSQIPSEPFSNIPPNFTTSLSGCFPNSTLDAGQTIAKQDPDLKSQILVLWTREEDEKLLHLAKLMPTQWRRIASIVGRASSQCLERYGNLVVPNPESKPACPEPVGLDENEKEVLSEARARLANTKGKMAKRRAREKQLEEARRLASLHRKRKLEVDYNAAIRFQKSAPANEDPPALPTGVEGLEAQLDVSRNKISERQDAPAAILRANMMLNDPESTRKRQKMMLPSDNELEGIQKMGYASDLLAENEELPEGSAALLDNNSQTPRQGTVAGRADAIVMEAENLAPLTDSQTPLLEGENLHPFHFSAVTPVKEEIQTSDPMFSPSMTHGAAAALTPRIGLTPSKDELHLNKDMDMDESEELMIGEKTETEAEEDNAGKTLVTLKLLCHFKRRAHRNFSTKVDNIMERDGRVSVKVGKRHFEKDYEYLIVSISALEDSEEESSPTLEAARRLFSCCCHCTDKPHLQRLLIGISQISLIADRMNSFKTSYIEFESKDKDQEIFKGVYKGLGAFVRENHSNMFERFTVELLGPRNEVKKAFEEAIVVLRKNCFTSTPK